MKPLRSRALSTLLASTAFLAGAAQVNANFRLLPTSTGDVQSIQVSQNISTRWTDVTEIAEPGLGSGFRATFAQGEAYVQSNFASEINASSYDGMYFVLRNSGTTPSRSSVELLAHPQPNTPDRLLISLVLQPGETKRVIVYFQNEAVGKQMGVHPPILDLPAQILGYGSNFGQERLTGWLMWNTGGRATVELKDLRLVRKRRDFTGLIDAYGQKSDLAGDWKVTSDADLLSRSAQEANDLAAAPDAATAVGTSALGTTKASGRWRFERATNGNWFAVAPTGSRQWIVGANNVMMDGQMVLDGKEEMYTSLPPREGPFGQFYSTAPYFPTGEWLRTFDMYKANLYKKHGPDYQEKWRNQMTTRLRKWGINAMSGTLDQGMVQGTTPYIRHMVLFYFPKKLYVPRVMWAHPNDPFAPEFAPWCLSEFKRVYGYEIANKPTNNIGVAVGNEETWGHLSADVWTYQIPIAALNAAPTQPCKAPMIAVLTKKYSTIAKLNAAWGTSFASWASLSQANALGSFNPVINAAMRTDLKALLTAYADKYYGTIREQLLKAGYRGLFLGSRDALDQTPDEVLQVQNKYVDAHTLNNYESDEVTWGRIAKLTKPVLLTEFSFSAVDRGHNSPNKNFEVGTQAERAVRIRGYLDRAAAVKNVAGVFFYGFAECPFSARWSDDERLNVGLVDITDSPYKEVTDTFRAFGTALPTLRPYR